MTVIQNLRCRRIYGIKNFRLLGLYILEPAEPVPPMSEMILTLSVSRRWQFLVSAKIWI